MYVGERQVKGAQAVLNSAPFRFSENLMLTSENENRFQPIFFTFLTEGRKEDEDALFQRLAMQ